MYSSRPKVQPPTFDAGAYAVADQRSGLAGGVANACVEEPRLYDRGG
jgi:hypothetical protein